MKVIHNLENVEYFQLSDISSKTQGSYCSNYWAESVVYCTCGTCLIPTYRVHETIDQREIRHTIHPVFCNLKRNRAMLDVSWVGERRSFWWISEMSVSCYFRVLLVSLASKLPSPWEEECWNSQLLSKMKQHCTVYMQTQLPSVLLSWSSVVSVLIISHWRALRMNGSRKRSTAYDNKQIYFTITSPEEHFICPRWCCTAWRILFLLILSSFGRAQLTSTVHAHFVPSSQPLSNSHVRLHEPIIASCWRSSVCWITRGCWDLGGCTLVHVGTGSWPLLVLWMLEFWLRTSRRVGHDHGWKGLWRISSSRWRLNRKRHSHCSRILVRQTRSNAIIFYDSVPADCIERVVNTKTKVILHLKLLWMILGRSNGTILISMVPTLGNQLRTRKRQSSRLISESKVSHKQQSIKTNIEREESKD